MGSLTLFQLGYCTSYNKMGRVRTKTVKKAAKLIIEKYYTRLTLDFHVNKRMCEEIPSNCKRKNVRGETTTFLRLQSWILTPLKLMLRPRYVEDAGIGQHPKTPSCQP